MSKSCKCSITTDYWTTVGILTCDVIYVLYDYAYEFGVAYFINRFITASLDFLAFILIIMQ